MRATSPSRLERDVAQHGRRRPAVEVGAPADLIVYRDDPRADPAVLRHPELVLLRGRPYRP